MKILVDNQEVETNDLKIIGDGNEGVVYKYHNSALKVYKESNNKFEKILNPKVKRIIDYDDIQKFLELKTSRILLPRKIIYKLEDGCGYYGGYSTNLINNIISPSNMWETLPDYLKKEEEVILKDLELLNENNIAIYDFDSSGNFLYNGKMYFIDAGSLQTSSFPVSKDNQEQMNIALHTHLFLLSNSLENITLELNKMLKRKDITDLRIITFVKKVYNDIYETLKKDYSNYFEFLKDILYFYRYIENYKLEILKEATEDEKYFDLYEENVELLKLVLGR